MIEQSPVFYYMSFDEIVTDLMLYKMSEATKRYLRGQSDQAQEVARVMFPLINNYYRLTDQANTHTNDILPSVFCQKIFRTIWGRLQ
jgi:hypothetical protein